MCSCFCDVKGTGEIFTNIKHIFNVVRFSAPANSGPETQANVELLHLTGSCSLSSLVLGFVHTAIKPTYLPWTVYSNGKTYSPDNGQVNAVDLLTLTESSSDYMLPNHTVIGDIDTVLLRGQAYLDQAKTELDHFAARCGSFSTHELNSQLAHAGKSIDQIFIDYLKLFVYVYKPFDVPMQFLCLNANQIKTSESLLIQVQAYLPSAQNYITVIFF